MRLYSDLQQSGRRLYFALDSAPSVVSPGVATLTINGRIAAISDQSVAFRTPATAALTLTGLSLSSPSLLSPATAGLALAGRQASLLTSITIYVSAPTPVEAAEPSYAPTLITEMLVSPGKATLTIQALELNVSQGGNIGFLSPGRALLTLNGLAANFLFTPDQAALQIIGYAPTLTLNSNLEITPDPAVLTMAGAAPVLGIPFVWIDDDPVTPSTWIDDPRV
jgi:hypothetical protein